MTTTVSQLSNFTTALDKEVGESFRPLHVEHSASGWFLYARNGSKELLFGKTKDELWERMHALALGIRIAKGEER